MILKLSKVTLTLVRANMKFFLVAIFLHANISPMTTLGTVKHAHMVCLCMSVLITLAMTISEISNWISLRSVRSAAEACKENSPILLSLPSIPSSSQDSKCEHWELLNSCQLEYSRRQYLQSVKGNQGKAVQISVGVRMEGWGENKNSHFRLGYGTSKTFSELS